MTKKRKASLGLGSLGQDDSIKNNLETEEDTSKKSPTLQKPIHTEKEVIQEKTVSKKKKKQILPLYIEPALHDALHTLVFSERHKKATFQTLFMEGLDLALKERGLPSVAELSSGEKTLNL